LLRWAGDTLMALLAKQHAAVLDDIVARLNVVSVTFFGEIFLGLIDAGRRCDSGAVVRSLRLRCAPQVVRLETWLVMRLAYACSL